MEISNKKENKQLMEKNFHFFVLEESEMVTQIKGKKS